MFVMTTDLLENWTREAIASGKTAADFVSGLPGMEENTAARRNAIRTLEASMDVQNAKRDGNHEDGCSAAA